MKVFVLLALVAAVAAAPQSTYQRLRGELIDRRVLYPQLMVDPLPGAKETTFSNGRIVGGQEADPHSWPFIVALSVDDRYFCGGSILDESTILTAAHCLDGARSVEVIAGAHNWRVTENEQQRRISTDLTVNPDWDSGNLHNDLAIAKLPTPLEFNSNVQPTVLPESDPNNDSIGRGMTAIGWGKENDGFFTGVSDTLNYVTDLELLPHQDCGEIYGQEIDYLGLLCISAAGGHGTCSGDSGGPLVQQDGIATQIGITSFGSSAGCERGFPDGFTDIYFFLDWVMSNME